jgi:hypothetical protein
MLIASDARSPVFELGQESWTSRGGQDGSNKQEPVSAAHVVTTVGPQLAPFVWRATAREAFRRSQVLLTAIEATLLNTEDPQPARVQVHAVEQAIEDLAGLIAGFGQSAFSE